MDIEPTHSVKLPASESIDSPPLVHRRIILSSACVAIFIGVGLGGRIGNWIPLPRTAAIIPLAVTLLLFFRQRAAWSQMKRLRIIKSPFLLLLLWACLSALSSEQIGRSFILYLVGGIIAAFFYALATVIKSDDDLTFLNRTLITTAFLVCVRGIYEFSVTSDEVTSSLPSPNHLAGFILILLPLAVLNLTRAKNLTGKLWLGSAVTVMIICLFLTFSRGGMLGFMAEAVAFFIIRKKKTLILILIPALLAVLLIHDELFNLVSTLWDREYSTNIQRVELWQASLAMISERPVLGFGPGTFSEVYSHYLTSSPARQVPAPCNVFLHVGVMGGLSGLFVTLWLLIILIKQSMIWQSAPGLSLSKQTVAAVVFISTIGILTQGFFDY